MRYLLKIGNFVILLLFTACQPGPPDSVSPMPAITAETARQLVELPTSTPFVTPIPTMEAASIEFDALNLLDETSISLWYAWEGDLATELIQIVESFHEEYPGIKVELSYIPFGELQKRFESEEQSSKGPTLVIGPTNWAFEFNESRLLKDLSTLSALEVLEEVNESALDGVRYKRGLIGMPFLFSKGVVLFRNTSIVQSAPASFDELVNISQEVTHGGVVGAFLDYGFIFSGAHLNRLGGQLMDDTGAPSFNQEKGLDWAKLLMEYKEAGPVIINSNIDLEYFKEGSVGMIIDGTWNIRSIEESIGEENLAIDPWPEPLSGYFWTESIFMGSTVTDLEMESGWTFMKFLLSTEIQTQLGGTGVTGPFPVVNGIEVIDPIKFQALEAFKGSIGLPVLPEMNVYWDPMNNALEQFMNSNISPGEALTEAESEIISLVTELRESRGN